MYAPHKDVHEYIKIITILLLVFKIELFYVKKTLSSICQKLVTVDKTGSSTEGSAVVLFLP